MNLEEVATGSGDLRSAQFRREREKSWRELENLIDRASRAGPWKLKERDLFRLPALYRATVASLSVARAMVLDRGLQDYLESLVARAHLVVYSPRRRLLTTLGEHFGARFPALIRAHVRVHGIALGAFLAGVAVSMIAVTNDPTLYGSFVAEGMANGRNFEASVDWLRGTLYDGADSGNSALSSFSTYLFVHNSGVGILAFVIGILGGVPGLLLLFTNGMMLGAMSALFHCRGLGFEWWAWLLPHGITEILAIVLCGGSGLLLARALLFPGRHSRVSELARLGRDAGRMVLCCLALFFLAGVIEGLFRQLIHSVAVRYGLALITLGLWVAYFRVAGRGFSKAERGAT